MDLIETYEYKGFLMKLFYNNNTKKFYMDFEVGVIERNSMHEAIDVAKNTIDEILVNAPKNYTELANELVSEGGVYLDDCNMVGVCEITLRLTLKKFLASMLSPKSVESKQKKLFPDAIGILLQDPEDENALTAAIMLLKWYRSTQPVQPQVAEELREIEEEVSYGIKSNSYVWGNWSENAEKVSYLFSKQNMYEQGHTTAKGF